MTTEHNITDVIHLFNNCFKDSCQTVLVKGDGEPIYLPKSETCVYHQLIFAHGFYASALHEIGHWCVAGNERRELEDFGYWYKPDGRTLEEQKIFEDVEVKPQALEWIFSVSVGRRFRVSADNLAAGIGASDAFKAKVYQQVMDYLSNGLPSRADQFVQALLNFYQPGKSLTADLFLVETL